MVFNNTSYFFCNEQQIINNFLAQNPIYNFNLIGFVSIIFISGFMIMFEDSLQKIILKNFNILNFKYKWILNVIFNLPRLFVFGLPLALLMMMVFS